MKYDIYHRTPIFFEWILKDPLSKEDYEKLLNWPANYHKVGELNAESLQEVFYRTQNITRGGWVREPLVTRVWEHSAVPDDQLTADPDFIRSTSIGDVMIDETGKMFVVAALGFSEIGTQEPEQPNADKTIPVQKRNIRKSILLEWTKESGGGE